jgi:hypothetical protein
VELVRFLIPVYHKIRLPFSDMYCHYVSKKESLGQGDVTVDLYLTTVQAYKSFLMKQQIEEKSTKLQRGLPRFIWIERVFSKGHREPIHDDIFDGTAIHCHRLESVDYQGV